MKYKFFILFSLIFLSIVGAASAIKVSGRVEIPFEPGLEYEGELCIVPEGINKVELKTKGVFADNIELEETIFEIDGSYGCIPYTLNLPEETEKPGLLKSSIVVKEAPDTREGGNIVALVSIGHQIWVDVPYPGKYVEVGLGSTNAEEGEDVKFTSTFNSRGDKAINFISGRIEIYDNNGTIVDTITGVDVNNIQPQEKRTITRYWNTSGMEVGDYSARLFVEYANESVEAGTQFKIGSLEVRLKDYTATVFKKGVVPFYVRAESYWSEEISNVRATVDVKSNGAVLQSFETLAQNLRPWRSVNLKGYVDTGELELGNYTLDINLHYAGRTDTYNGTLDVTEEPVPEEETPGVFESMNMTSILLISTILLAIIAAVLALKVIFKDKN